MTPLATGHPIPAFAIGARVFACGASGEIKGIASRRDPPRIRYLVLGDDGAERVVEAGEVGPC